ncbi:MAG: hypothetical protein M3321_05535 [Actinomycetota bacterium]|nr:hypothetical protein [Actinomycetota bacterium]
MGRRLFLAAAALGLVLPAWALAQATELRGTVGPGFNISLTRADGSEVTNVPPGAYTVRVDDRGTEHNFHLRGPGGVDMATSAPAVETVTWNVTLVDGLYTFVCDVHPTQMRGQFTVGAGPPPSPPPPPPAPVVRRLTVSVGPGRSIRVSARTVRAGRYRITVNDRSARDNFHLTGPGVNRRTGVAFRGRATWTVTLRRGTYRFRSDATAGPRGTLRVT